MFDNNYFISYSAFSDNVFNTPDNVLPPDCNAPITFLAGESNAAITSATSSFLDFIVNNASK